jgi:hypothetical protein
MAILSAYLDDSGHDGDDFFVFGGAMASQGAWEAITTQWIGIYRIFGLSFLHMKKWASWDAPESVKADCMAQLIAALRRERVEVIAFGCDLKDYEAINAHYRLDERYSAKSLVAMMVAALIERSLRFRGIGSEDVQFIFEAGTTGWGKVADTLAREGVHAVTMIKTPEAVPLHVADLIAWECNRELRSEPERFQRKSFLALYDLPGIWSKIDGSALEQLCAGSNIPIRD